MEENAKCQTCEGRGWIAGELPITGAPVECECWDCDGSGVVAEAPALAGVA